MSINVKKIHSMQWTDEQHTYVSLIADTDTGNDENISTPYSEESIIWDSVREFPVNDIKEYVKPELPPELPPEIPQPRLP